MNNFSVHVLASGSKGNATLVQTDKQNFLIDLGISCRELTRKLKVCGLDPSQLEAVFITHEHADHIKGIVTFMKKHNVPIYTSRETWKALALKLGSLKPEQCLVLDHTLELGDIAVASFPVPHDARDPHGYSFVRRDNQSKFTYLTDTGFITDQVREAADGCDTLILECNHDIDMLKKGSYPYELKQRILSTQGHLSNTAAGYLLTQIRRLPKVVFLAHLSEENNTPALALQTVSQQLEAAGKLQEVRIYVTSQRDIISNTAASTEAALF